MESSIVSNSSTALAGLFGASVAFTFGGGKMELDLPLWAVVLALFVAPFCHGLGQRAALLWWRRRNAAQNVGK